MQGGGSVAVQSGKAGAFYNGLDELLRGKLAGLGVVRIRWMGDLERVIVVDGVGREELDWRGFVILVIVLVRRIREMMRASLQR